MNSVTIRAELVSALRDDLIGPEPDDAAHAMETLSTAPSHWYLTGFLAPTGQPLDEKEDEAADEELTSLADSPEEGEPEAPVARRPVFPSSIGLTVLVHAETRVLKVRITYGTYTPKTIAASGEATERKRPSSRPPALEGEQESGPRVVWVREPHIHEVTITLEATPRIEPTLPEGILLRAVVRDVPATELLLVPPGTRYVTLFLVNQRNPVPKPEQDRGFMFQVGVGLTCAEGLVERPNLRGARMEDELDERIGDLQYRDAFEYAVGHGISVSAKVMGRSGDVFCHEVATAWIPEAEVEKVIPSPVSGVELRMEELGKLADGAAVQQAMGGFVPAYQSWIEDQATRAAAELRSPVREQTARALLGAATTACARIQRGIALLAESAQALEAFRIANRARKHNQPPPPASARGPRRALPRGDLSSSPSCS